MESSPFLSLLCAFSGYVSPCNIDRDPRDVRSIPREVADADPRSPASLGKDVERVWTKRSPALDRLLERSVKIVRCGYTFYPIVGQLHCRDTLNA